MSVAEKDFQTEFLRGLRTQTRNAWKIPDLPVSLMKAGRFTEKKPFDCFFTHKRLKGKMVVCELKQARAGTLNVSGKSHGLQDHQEDALLTTVDQDGFGLVVVNFQFQLKGDAARRAGYADVDRAFAGQIEDVVAARVNDRTDSLKVAWWEKNGVEMPLCSVKDEHGKDLRAWDPAPLIDWLWEWV